MEIHGYSKIYTLGHAALTELFNGPVVVEEKVDGSQFSARRQGDQLHFRSRGACISLSYAPKLFKPAMDYFLSIKEQLVDGWIYRGEALCAPRHNTLTYARVPRHNVVLFDIETGLQSYLTPAQKRDEAARLGLETVPCFSTNATIDMKALLDLVMNDSFLGGCKMEGVVIKNYARFDKDGKVLMGKYVREEFKEAHRKVWKVANPTQGDIIESLSATYRNENRWEKAIQHLRDAGQLVGEPKDIGGLIEEFKKDVTEECGLEIRDRLYEYALPKILRGATAGLAEFYKKKLLAHQFDTKEN